MGRLKIRRWLLVCLPILACVPLVLPMATQAAGKATTPDRPTVSTGAVTHIRGTSATLVGTVNPRLLATTYYFQYGATIAYGKQSAVASLPAGDVLVKVGQAVTGLLPGYHYRLVATNADGSRLGKDRTFVSKTTLTTKFVLAKAPVPTVYGKPVSITGTVTGIGNANRKLVLQSSPYPYLTQFSTVGVPVVTDASGRFAFRIASLLTSTQFRVSTLDPRPVYSAPLTLRVALRVNLKVRTTSHKGIVRLYGTVTPAAAGAHVTIQLLKPARPGRSEKAEERTTKYVTQFRGTVKRGTKTVSRFSVIATIHRAGRYRAFVQTTKGGYVSGASSSVVLAAAGSSGKKK